MFRKTPSVILTVMKWSTFLSIFVSALFSHILWTLSSTLEEADTDHVSVVLSNFLRRGQLVVELYPPLSLYLGRYDSNSTLWSVRAATSSLFGLSLSSTLWGNCREPHLIPLLAGAALPPIFLSHVGLLAISRRILLQGLANGLALLALQLDSVQSPTQFISLVQSSRLHILLLASSLYLGINLADFILVNVLFQLRSLLAMWDQLADRRYSLVSALLRLNRSSSLPKQPC